MKRALFALTLLVGCKEEVFVTVNCVTTATPALECELKQTKGKSEVEVCWDFLATCENGAVVKTHACDKVKDGGTTKTTIAADKLENLDKCKGKTPPQAKIENMTLNGKKPTK